MSNINNTLVNILSSYIPGDERVISIEYENNYSLRISHLIKLIASDDPVGYNSYKKLLALAGTMRADRLVLGEFLSSETNDALNNINDRFPGSLLRVVARSPLDALDRLETFVQLDKPTLAVAKIRKLIGSSIDLIAYQERLPDGTRVVKNIVEVLDELDSDNQIVLKEIFGVEQIGIKDGMILRRFVSYGPPSKNLMEKLSYAGIELPPAMFVDDASSKKTKELSERDKRAIKFSKGNYVFISYSRNDRGRVHALAKELENNGFYVWLDILDIEPGADWTKNLEKAIKNAGAFLIILTPAAANSQFVRNEINMAQDEKLPIIPVKMEECDVPIQIRALQYILYDKGNKAVTLNTICETLSRYISNKRLFGVI